jgi:hypothetical protein
MNWIRHGAVAWCALFVACGGSTNDRAGSSTGDGGGSGKDAGQSAATTGGAAEAGGTSGAGGTSSAGGTTGSGAVYTGGRRANYGATTGAGPDGGVDCTGRGPFCDPPPDPEPPGKALCGGVECTDGQACCLNTLKCYDPANKAAACPTRVPSTPDPNGRPACASNADCAADEYCETNGYAVGGRSLCGGTGFCQSRSNCGVSQGMEYCGCDGRTYPNVQTACYYGTRIAQPGACGSQQTIGGGGASSGRTFTVCGADSQCPSGSRCCAITGLCYTDAEAGLCAYPPEGTSRACLTNADCFSDTEYCAGTGCGTPGGCKSVGQCGALLKPVCGCDSQTYVNADCAASKGVRVKSDGECP